MSNQTEKLNGYKFPGCQKYWLIKRKQLIDDSDETYFFDISMAYSMFYFRGKTLEEAEDYLLKFIKEKAHKKLKAAEKLVESLNDYLDFESFFTREELLEKYKIKG